MSKFDTNLIVTQPNKPMTPLTRAVSKTRVDRVRLVKLVDSCRTQSKRVRHVSGTCPCPTQIHPWFGRVHASKPILPVSPWLHSKRTCPLAWERVNPILNQEKFPRFWNILGDKMSYTKSLSSFRCKINQRAKLTSSSQQSWASKS